jgi:hypothetical protein
LYTVFEFPGEGINDCIDFGRGDILKERQAEESVAEVFGEG